jgi:hypothetical protein
MPALHQSALANLEIFKSHVPSSKCVFDLRCEDLTKLTSWKIQPVPDVLLCHATLFDNDLFSTVQLIAEECPPGTLFVVVSKELRTGFITGIETLWRGRMEFSWGVGTVVIQRRVVV